MTGSTGPAPAAPGRGRLEIARDAADSDRRERTRPFALRLDGALWLRVSAAELAELGVSDGDELRPARRVELEHLLARVRARAFTVRSLAARAQSVAEIAAKLERCGVPPDLVAETIDLARGYGYLDDATLAGQLARGHQVRGYGRRRAELALRARLLPREVATTALDEAYAGADETEAAVAALGARRFGDGDAGRRRAAAFLARRGFSSTAAWAAVRQREGETGR
jgi:SOS response regulatory protein OraA/RecX